MPKRVLDVGNCSYDHAAIRRMIEDHFDARLTQAHDLNDTLTALTTGDVCLVLINRRLYSDGSPGIEIIRRLKADPNWAGVPVMLLTNFPEHQQQAVEAGAEPGFGKAELSDPATLEKLAKYLDGEPRQPS